MIPSGTAQKILVVDDDRTILEISGQLLRSAGYEVRTAQDAFQGTSLAQRERPALILLDLQMPAGGGELTLQRVRSLAGTARVPVVVCTSCDRPEVRRRVRDLGADGFLPKPFSGEALLAAVDAGLAAGRASGEARV
jgi:DNA-binding response OmpR family regulator